MTARRVGMMATLVTMGGAGWYVAVYLARWEWNRAVVAGIIFLAAELALVGVLVLDRLGRLEQRIDERTAVPPAEPDSRVVAHIHEAAPPSSEPFAWLRTGEATNGNRLSVFVPVLLGAGVILSGVAWVVGASPASPVVPCWNDVWLAGSTPWLCLPEASSANRRPTGPTRSAPGRGRRQGQDPDDREARPQPPAGSRAAARGCRGCRRAG